MDELLSIQEKTFHEAEPTAEDMASSQTADTHEGELLLAVLELEEELERIFQAARIRSLVLMGLVALLLFIGVFLALAR